MGYDPRVKPTARVLAAVLLTGTACHHAPPALQGPDAATVIAADPIFTKTVDRLPLAEGVVDTAIGVDAGVIDRLWKIDRDGNGTLRRQLTPHGREIFKDMEGTLATPARRELVRVDLVTPDPGDEKHQTAAFS